MRDEDIAWKAMLAKRGDLRTWVQKVVASGELYESPTSAELEKLGEDEIIDLMGDTIHVVHGHDIHSHNIFSGCL